MSLPTSRREATPHEILPLTTVLASPIPLSAEPAGETRRWLLVLILLPLIVTLLFLLWQFTPWGDACPEEAPCERPVAASEHVAAANTTYWPSLWES